jgi:hypothetical protein
MTAPKLIFWLLITNFLTLVALGNAYGVIHIG